MGAWIETILANRKITDFWSHPIWVRGLKQDRLTKEHEEAESHPIWVRGLKLAYQKIINDHYKSHPIWVRGLKRRNAVGLKNLN